MSNKAVFDTSVYIQAIRTGNRSKDYSLLLDSLPFTYLCSVVSAELHKGAVDRIGQKLVHQISARFKNVGRIITPSHSSWNNAGKLLARIRQKEPAYHSAIHRLFNDVLIVMSVLQIGAILYTRNEKHFRLIQHYTAFGLEIVKE